MKQVATFLLALACVVPYFTVAHAKCCYSSMTIVYSVENDTCIYAGFPNLDSSGDCIIIICDDGRPRVGHCGIGCTLFGCGCHGGCITGNGQENFLNYYNWKKITIKEVKYNDHRLVGTSNNITDHQ